MLPGFGVFVNDSERHIGLIIKNLNNKTVPEGVMQGLCIDQWTLADSLGLSCDSCIRPQLTAAILLLGPRSDGNRRRHFPCSAFSSTCYA